MRSLLLKVKSVHSQHTHTWTHILGCFRLTYDLTGHNSSQQLASELATAATWSVSPSTHHLNGFSFAEHLSVSKFQFPTFCYIWKPFNTDPNTRVSAWCCRYPRVLRFLVRKTTFGEKMLDFTRKRAVGRARHFHPSNFNVWWWIFDAVTLRVILTLSWTLTTSYA